MLDCLNSPALSDQCRNVKLTSTKSHLWQKAGIQPGTQSYVRTQVMENNENNG